jgi:hypothetical protein
MQAIPRSRPTEPRTAVVALTPPPRLYALRTQTRAEADAYWKAFERTRTWWYRRITTQTVRALAQEQAVLQAALHRAHSPSLAVVACELALNERRTAWRTFLWTVYRQVTTDFAVRVQAGLKADGGGERKDTAHPLVLDPFGAFGPAQDWWKRDVLQWLNLEAAKKVTQILDTTRKAIGQRLSEGVAKGEGIDALARRLRGLYEETYRGRSVTIARTEVIAASNLGSRAGALATGLTLTHHWIATGDGRTRPWHRVAWGQTHPMGIAYVVAGQQLLFPGDTSLGATAKNIVACRCTEGFTRA